VAPSTRTGSLSQLQNQPATWSPVRLGSVLHRGSVEPITQATLGAAASVAFLGNRSPLSLAQLAWIGALGGAAADLDVLIRSSTDPLLAIEYHRHFTHSLPFVPVGGTLAALPWWLHAKLRPHFRYVIAASVVGYATHGLLDACTTYGTQLFWPFSSYRASWAVVSVVDPLFTLPLLGLLIWAVRRKAARFARIGLLVGLAYLGLGGLQRQRALALQAAMAERRGHHIERSDVFPSFMNDVTYRSLYEYDGRYWVDKIRVPWTGGGCVTPGSSMPQVVPPPPEGLPASSARAHRLFHWFSANWVAVDPEDSTVLGDVRYSFSPTELTPVWGVRIDDQSGKVEWINNRGRRGITVADYVELVSSNGPDAYCP